MSENPTADEHPSEPGPEAGSQTEPPTVPVAAGPEPEPPTVEHTAVPETANAPAAPVPPAGDGTPPESGSSSWWDGPRIVVVGLLVLLLGAGAGFLVGRSTADSGPTSLADAASQTAKGDLPAGDLSLQQLLQDLGQGSGNGNGNAGGLGGLLGGLLGGKNGDSSNLLNGLLNQLRDRLGHESGSSGSGSGNGSNGNGSNGSSGTTSSEAFLGISAAAAPTGQSGVQVAAVAASGPAAGAGLQAGDVITAIDGTAVSNPAALVTAIHTHQPGDQVTITYTRGGKSTDVKVRLGNSATADTRPASPTTPPATGTA